MQNNVGAGSFALHSSFSFTLGFFRVLRSDVILAKRADGRVSVDFLQAFRVAAYLKLWWKITSTHGIRHSCDLTFMGGA